MNGTSCGDPAAFGIVLSAHTNSDPYNGYLKYTYTYLIQANLWWEFECFRHGSQ